MREHVERTVDRDQAFYVGADRGELIAGVGALEQLVVDRVDESLEARVDDVGRDADGRPAASLAVGAFDHDTRGCRRATGAVEDSNLEVFDGSAWKNLSKMPQARQYCGAVALSGKLVVLGGYRESIDVFDPATSAVFSNSIPEMKTNPNRWGLAAVSF